MNGANTFPVNYLEHPHFPIFVIRLAYSYDTHKSRLFAVHMCANLLKMGVRMCAILQKQTKKHRFPYEKRCFA